MESNSLARNPRLLRDLGVVPVRRAEVVASIRVGDGSRLELDADNNVSINGRLLGTVEPDGIDAFRRLAGL